MPTVANSVANGNGFGGRMEGVNRADVHGLLPSLKRPAIVHFKGSTSVKRAHGALPAKAG